MYKKVLLILIILGIAGIGGFYFNQKPQPKLGAVDLALQGKTAKEKANIKANLIAQENLIGTYTDNKYNQTIEIRSVNQIDGGIEIIARAWKGVNPIGFSKDGSVEWERFRIFNPPIMVDDPIGTVVRVWTDSNGDTKTRKLREDPKEAIKQVLAHTISVSAKSGNRIIAGKTGNTTLTVFSEAGSNNAGQDSVDGMARRASVDEVWTAIQSGSGTNVQDISVSDNCAYFVYTTTTDQFGQLGRSPFLFDTSSILAGSTINSATLSVDGGDVAIVNSGAANITIGVATSSPVSNSALTNSDYQIFANIANQPPYRWGSTLLSTSSTAIASWNTGGYNNFGLTATTGINVIQAASTTKLGLREYTYDMRNIAPAWTSGAQSLVGCMYADNAGTTRDPKLVVDYSEAVSGFNSKRKIIIVE